MSLALYRKSGVPSLFNNFFADEFLAPSHRIKGGAGRNPAVDIFEEDDLLKFQFDLPGIEKKDIRVEYKDGVLLVENNRQEEAEESKGRYFTRERYTGDFSRSFRIGDHYDARKIEAVFHNGVLTLTIPKSEESKPVSVKIQ